MWKHIQRLRQFDEKNKSKLSLIISGIITFIIGAIWIIFFIRSVSIKNDVADDSPSMFSSTIAQFQKVFKNNPFSGK